MTTFNPIEQLIDNVKQADSTVRLVTAVQALAAFGSEASIPTLIEVLSYNNPGAAAAALKGLIGLGKVAVPHKIRRKQKFDLYEVLGMAASIPVAKYVTKSSWKEAYR